MRFEPLTRGKRRRKVEAVHDREAKSARRHGMLLRRTIFMKGNLHARYTGRAFDLFDKFRRGMPIASAVRSEQHDTVAFARLVIFKDPLTGLVKPPQRIAPARSVKIGPLVGKAQMCLDDGAPDCFELQHAGIPAKMLSH